MDHWDQVLPDFILRVQHEDVADLEGEVKRMLSRPSFQAILPRYLGHNEISELPVRTGSHYSFDGSRQWRNFEKHLKPLTDALGPVSLRYDKLILILSTPKIYILCRSAHWHALSTGGITRTFGA